MAMELQGIPLMPSVARRIAEELFQKKSIWQRAELVREVEKFHRDGGGAPGKQDSFAIVKKALQMLQSDGKVAKAQYGHWQWVTPQDKPIPEEQAVPMSDLPLLEQDDTDEDEVEGIER